MAKKKRELAKNYAVRKLDHAIDSIEDVIIEVENNTDTRSDSYHELLGDLSSIREKLSDIQPRIDAGDFTDLFDPHPIEQEKVKRAKA